MMMFLRVVLITFYIKVITSIPVSTQVTPNAIEILERSTLGVHNKTTEKNTLDEDQTENVKKIIADQLELSRPEYPVVTKQDPQREIDKLSLEELQTKCLHLARLFNINRTNPITSNRHTNHKNPDTQARPVYYPPKTNLRPRYPSTSRPNGFYITSQPSTTKRPTTVDIQPTTPIKYIRLEPVILQKTILGDGRTVYYWHKSLPTAVEYPSNYSPPVQDEYQNEYNYQHIQNNYGYPPSTGYYINSPNVFPSSNNFPPIQYTTVGKINEDVTTEATTTSTTEENNYSYGFSNFIPFYSFSQDSTSTSEPSTTTVTSTTKAKPPPDNVPTNDLLYAQQLKFVIPVPIDDRNGGIPVRQPWNFDPYAYYPNQLQPNSLNVQVPYSPTFHMIRAVTIPKTEGKLFDKLDEVNVE